MGKGVRIQAENFKILQKKLFSDCLDLPPPISYNSIQPTARICKKVTEVFIRHLFKPILNIHIHITRGMK